jgi:hypothetical protein
MHGARGEPNRGDARVSLEQLRRAFATECRGPGQQLLLVVMADLADEAGGNVFPSQATLARRCRIDERTVRRFLTDLLADGQIRQAVPASGRAPAQYVLTLNPIERERATRPGNTPTVGDSPGQRSTVDRQIESVRRAPRPPIPQNPSEPEDAGARARARPVDASGAPRGNGSALGPVSLARTLTAKKLDPIADEIERRNEIQRRRVQAAQIAETGRVPDGASHKSNKPG